MNAYSTLAAAKRLEAAGINRKQAEALAAELGDVMSQLVTKEQLDAALDRQTIKLGVMLSGIIALAATLLGAFLSH